jgi:hypothetical protein
MSYFTRKDVNGEPVEPEDVWDDDEPQEYDLTGGSGGDDR